MSTPCALSFAIMSRDRLGEDGKSKRFTLVVARRHYSRRLLSSDSLGV